MKLSIRNIKFKNTQNERVVLFANEDCEIGLYFLLLTRRSGTDEITNEIEFPFWLPNRKVKKGDLVIIYTKEGNKGYKSNEDGSNSYFYYRGIPKPILNDDRIILLVEASAWETDR